MDIYACKISEFENLDCLHLLDDSRRERLARLRSRDDKLRCICAGLLLRYLLGDKVSDIAYGENGKPYLPQGGIFFNLSHSGDYVVLSSDSEELGVDIEKLRPVLPGVVARSSTLGEREWLERQNGPSSFIKLWTAKEAVMKASGKGFAMPAGSFSVLPVQNGLHTIDGQKCYLHWYELDAHIICTASKSPKPASLRLLGRAELMILRQSTEIKGETS